MFLQVIYNKAFLILVTIIRLPSKCGGLDESVPTGLYVRKLDPQLVGGTVCEELGCVALLKELCQWRQTLRFQKLMTFPVIFLYLVLVDKNESLRLLLQHQVCLSAALLPTVEAMDSTSLEL